MFYLKSHGKEIIFCNLFLVLLAKFKSSSRKIQSPLFATIISHAKHNGRQTNVCSCQTGKLILGCCEDVADLLEADGRQVFDAEAFRGLRESLLLGPAGHPAVVVSRIHRRTTLEIRFKQ